MNRIVKSIWALIILTAILVSPISSFGQKKKSSGGSSYNWGVGVKLGDPLGVTVKKYNGNKAWEFIIGRSGYYYGGNDYYSYRFRHDNRFKNKGYTGYYYDGATDPIAIQIRHLFFHKPISGLDGLTWYAGLGGQFRYSHYYYHFYDVYGRHDDRIADLGLGVDGIIGLEYTFKDLPISVALDANLYMEIVDRPFLFIGQGGLSVRYNFK